MPRRLTAPTAFIAYALANTIGLGVLTGGAVRLRFYGAAGVEPAALTRAIGFNAVAFAIGIVVAGALATLLAADQAAVIAHVPAGLLRGAAALVLAGARRPAVALFARDSPLPSLSHRGAPAAVLSIIDIAASAAALWFLLPQGAVSLPAIHHFLRAGGRAGHHQHRARRPRACSKPRCCWHWAAPFPPTGWPRRLIVYRVVYYLVPLASALILLSVYELRRGVAAPVARAVSQVSPLLLAAFTFIVGVMLLVSGALPATDAATALLAMHVPLVLVEAAHFLGSIAGLALLIVARGMLARLDAAWWSGVIIAAISLVLALPKGIAVSEAGVLTFLLVALVMSRRHFTRKASLLAGAFEPAWWIATARHRPRHRGTGGLRLPRRRLLAGDVVAVRVRRPRAALAARHRGGDPGGAGVRHHQAAAPAQSRGWKCRATRTWTARSASSTSRIAPTPDSR